MKYLLPIFCFFFLTYAYDYASETYYVDKDTIIFCVKKLRSLNKNSDKQISRYIEKFSGRKSHIVNEYRSTSSKKGYYLLFFWKNINKNEYGFVIADRISSNVWKARLNGQKFWSKIQYGEEEIFRWFSEGRSIGVTLMNDKSYSIKFIFCGDIDF